MRFFQDVVPQYDLTCSDVFMVPSLSAVPSRLDVDLTTPDGLGTTIAVVVAHVAAVSAGYEEGRSQPTSWSAPGAGPAAIDRPTARGWA